MSVYTHTHTQRSKISSSHMDVTCIYALRTFFSPLEAEKLLQFKRFKAMFPLVIDSKCKSELKFSFKDKLIPKQLLSVNVKTAKCILVICVCHSTCTVHTWLPGFFLMVQARTSLLPPLSLFPLANMLIKKCDVSDYSDAHMV